jgi:hypothetical protein
MTQENSKWQDKVQVKKGDYGEDLVHTFLEEKGYIVYKPITEKAHAFDRLAVRNKSEILVVECKTKARRRYYPDTGINIKHYDEYKFISEKYKLHLFIFFIDEYLCEIYGNFLLELIKPVEVEGNKYPLEHKNIIYFPLINMKRNIAKLSEDDKEYLVKNSSRNYDYK